MRPTIGDHLDAIRRRLEETVLPAIPEAEGFAREQAAFVLADLDLVRAVHAHAYRYEVVDVLAARAALADLAAVAGTDASPEVGAALRALVPQSEEGSRSMASLTEQAGRLKQMAADLFGSLVAQGGAVADEARTVFAAAAAEQVVRERALFAPTGSTSSALSLDEALASVPPP